ncbi:ImmA/IrrE family metallo-endopeptidase [Dehalobacter sp.]|uniref:ImmA/IrrE family metallo-endopeptidase n=1 Tax=Dehalobacter sp. TaxID=1962289 RepID=UPI0025882ED8|nr:ImmA/IrrE family metallo-endopeptidase [Dehalobacter sp.]MDJ0304748.1 ImmA/IrrE family metallo-endopeptidase [Dehalobacter sp.]
MKYFDERYLTINKLSENSKHLIRIRLAEFLHTYNIKEYPINCVELLDTIINSNKLNLEKMENDQLSHNVDAAAEYYGEEYGYCIVLNTRKRGSFRYSSYRRFNFTIAHEIAHIILGHLLIPRRLKSKKHLDHDDLEADEFAGRLLVPERLLIKSNFISREAVAAEFLVSDQALFKRVNNLKRLDLFSSIPVATCKQCGNTDISPIAEFCIICGNELTSSNVKGVKQIEYTVPMELDHNSRIIICPICKNEEMSTTASFCRICGTSLFNECNGDKYQTNCYHKNPSNARYCEICGKQTIYSKENFLLSWQEERSEYIVNSTHR